jgi:hypothetical protein
MCFDKRREEENETRQDKLEIGLHRAAAAVDDVTDDENQIKEDKMDGICRTFDRERKMHAEFCW